MKQRSRIKLSVRPRLKYRRALIVTVASSIFIAGAISIILPLLKSEKSRAATLYMSFDSGSYIGNGLNDRAITGLSFQPSMVIIKAEDSYYSNIATADMPAGYSKNSGGPSAIGLNGITALNVNGFRLGTANEVNRSGTKYHWVAMGSGNIEMVSGKYTGNAVSGRQITGLGFTPDLIWVFGAGATNSFMRTVHMPVNMAYSLTGSGNSSRITNFVTNGFEVGNNADVNGSGTEYYYVAIKSNVGTAFVGSYTGDATTNRLISVSSFLNDFIMIKAHSSSDTRWKTSTVAGTVSLRMSSSYSASETSLINMGTGVFTVTNNSNVNSSGVLHSYLAFKKNSGTGPLPVEMLDFNVKSNPSSNTIELNWTTLTEVNNDYYSVLRSVDDQNYSVIGKVDGNGTTSNTSSYGFIDEFPVSGKLYYKLIQYDYDGHNKFYGPIMEEYKTSIKIETKIAIRPNPCHGQFEIIISGNAMEPIYMVHIINSGGKIVYQSTHDLSYNNTIVIDDISNLPSGTYIVKVDGVDETIGSSRIVII